MRAERYPPPPRVVAALGAAAAPVCAYVYDIAALTDRAGAVRAALPPGTILLYAMKANGHPAVVRALAAATDGLEVASGGELALAVQALTEAGPALTEAGRTIAPAGREPAGPESAGREVAGRAGRIVFGGPAKTDAELAAAVAHGALVIVESTHELRRLGYAARAAGHRVDAAVRVNRAGPVLPGSHTMTGQATPFGVDETQLGDLLAIAGGVPDLRIVGFGLHAVSNNLDAAAHAAFITDAVAWSVATAARHRVDLRFVDVGGGLGVDHVTGTHLDLAVLRTGLSSLCLPPGVDLVVEPGRLLAADAGWYAAEVIDLKCTHGRWFAVLRGGTHHFRLPAAWGYSHPFTVLPAPNWPYPHPRPEISDVAVDAVGELCTPRDVLTRAQHVSRLRVGDVLVFGRAGAYGWDISHHDFLRHPPPQFMIV